MKRNSSKHADHSAKKHSGFTLVELVVVIAVLAILAGVGAVAYRGYIKHAKEAADLELLSAVNTAFQAACMDEGMKTYPGTAAAPLDGDEGAKKVKLDSVVGGEVNMKDSFSKYYKGNEDKAFKVYQKLVYTGGGVFVGAGEGDIKQLGENGGSLTVVEDADGNMIYTYSNGDDKELTYKVSKETLNALADSTFGEMHVSKMFDNVDHLSYMFGKAALNAVNGFMGNVSSSEGGPTYKQLFEQFAKEAGVDIDDPQQVGNAAILYMGDMYKNYDPTDMNNQLLSDGYKHYYDPNNKLSALGLEEHVDDLGYSFAMVAGFANSEYGKEKCNVAGFDGTWAEYYNKTLYDVKRRANGEDGFWSTGSGGSALNMLETAMENMTKDQNFKDYYEKQGKADAQGYLGAMQFLSENKESLKGNGALSKGFGSTNTELGSIFDSIFQ